MDHVDVYRSRRQFLSVNAILGAGVICGALIETDSSAGAIPADTPEQPVHEQVDFSVGPARLYEAFLNERQFSAFTGAAAQIGREPGASFTYFGGRVSGRILELARDQRIVLAWHPANWAPGLYSIVRLEFVARGTGASVTLEQTGIPPEKRQAQIENWQNHVWEPLRKYLAA